MEVKRTLEQITTLLSLAVAVFAVIASIVNGVRSYYFSNEYKESTESRLKEKDDHIKTLEYFSSPNLREAYDSMKAMLEVRIDQLNSEVDEFRQKNESLKSQLDGTNFRIQELEKEILGMSISEKVRLSIISFAEGSRTALQDLGRTVSDLEIVEQNLQKNVDEMNKNIKVELKTARLGLVGQSLTVIANERTSDSPSPSEDNNSQAN